MSYRIRRHPAVVDDLDAITRWQIDYARPQSALSRLDEIASSLRAISAGRKAVIDFTSDDDTCEVHIQAVPHAGADWIRRSRSRGR